MSCKLKSLRRHHGAAHRLNSCALADRLRRSVLLLIAGSALIGAGCADDPRDMTYGTFRTLPSEERMKVLTTLSEQEVEDISTVTASHQADSIALDRKTLREIINEGEKIRFRIEHVPPTR